MKLSDYHDMPSRASESEPEMGRVDVVYLWVDLSDSALLEKRSAAMKEMGFDQRGLNHWSPTRDNGELRFSIASVRHFAPWIRNIFVVTNGQKPEWLEEEYPDVKIVDEREIMGKDSPTFNNHGLMCNLHRIEGLSEWFFQADDDFMLGREFSLEVFFDRERNKQICYLDRARRSVESEGFGLPNQAALIYEQGRIEHCKTYTRWATHVFRLWNKQVLAEIWERFGHAMLLTSRNKFRHATDIDMTSFYPYYSAITRRGIVRSEDDISHGMVSITNDLDACRRQISRIVRDRPKFIAVQDNYKKASFLPGQEMNQEFWIETYCRFFREMYPWVPQ